MNRLQANNFFKRKMKEIKSLNKKYSFETGGVYNGWVTSDYSGYGGDFIARVFIVDQNGYSVGRMTFEFNGNHCDISVKHYKPRDYEYEPNDDDFFFMLNYYRQTGRRLLSGTLKFFERSAKWHRENDYQRKVDWRTMNPPRGKNNRKGLKKKKIKNIMQKMIDNMCRPNYNGWGIDTEI
jgi:hypothetical protein